MGTIGIGLNTVCRIPGVNDYIFCYICNIDCFYVHNKYGGKCGPDPKSPGEFTCICAESEEEAESRNISLSSKDTCDYCLLPPLPAPVGKKLSAFALLRSSDCQGVQFINFDYFSLCGCYSRTEISANSFEDTRMSKVHKWYLPAKWLRY